MRYGSTSSDADRATLTTLARRAGIAAETSSRSGSSTAWSSPTPRRRSSAGGLSGRPPVEVPEPGRGLRRRRLGRSDRSPVRRVDRERGRRRRPGRLPCPDPQHRVMSRWRARCRSADTEPSSGAGPSGRDGAFFEAERPRLTGLAYRMLGSMADAEDVVSEAWMRFDAADRSVIESAGGVVDDGHVEAGDRPAPGPASSTRGLRRSVAPRTDLHPRRARPARSGRPDAVARSRRTGRDGRSRSRSGSWWCSIASVRSSAPCSCSTTCSVSRSRRSRGWSVGPRRTAARSRPGPVAVSARSGSSAREADADVLVDLVCALAGGDEAEVIGCSHQTWFSPATAERTVERRGVRSSVPTESHDSWRTSPVGSRRTPRSASKRSTHRRRS